MMCLGTISGPIVLYSTLHSRVQSVHSGGVEREIVPEDASDVVVVVDAVAGAGIGAGAGADRGDLGAATEGPLARVVPEPEPVPVPEGEGEEEEEEVVLEVALVLSERVPVV